MAPMVCGSLAQVMISCAVPGADLRQYYPSAAACLPVIRSAAAWFCASHAW